MNTQHPNQHRIQQRTIEALSDHQLEEWFAASGIDAMVVARCPLPGCAECTAHRIELASAA